MRTFSVIATALAVLAALVKADGECATVTKYVTTVSVSTMVKTVSVSYCPTSATYVTPCPVCPVATVTSSAQPIVISVTTTYKPTTLYCPTPGTYTYQKTTTYCPAATTITYIVACPTFYYCPYNVYLEPVKTVDVYCYEEEVLVKYQKETYVPLPPVTTTTTKYISEPTIFIYNDITINVTVVPTTITYDYTTTKTTTTTATVTYTPTPPPPPPPPPPMSKPWEWKHRAMRF